MSSVEKLTIFLPKRLAQTGGTSTFARNLKRGLESLGHQITFTWQPNYDLLLASPTAPLRYLIHAKIHHCPIIHRLDGVYYPGSSAGHLWRPLNWQLSLTRKHFATAVVYQSRYSKKACDQFLQPTNYKLQPSTIYNGVDTDFFSPEGEVSPLRDNSTQHLFITASRFRTEDQIIPLVEVFTYYRKYYESNAKLVLIGPFQGRVAGLPQTLQKTPGIELRDTIPHAQLPAHLRAADAFVMTHKTPPCPNNVLEAMACGLPICGVADGAMPELVSKGIEGELAPEPMHNGPFPVKVMANNLAHIMKNPQAYGERARRRAIHEFSLATMIRAYELLFRQTAQTQTSK